MRSLAALDGRHGEKTVVITDSGLGGLLICADLERRLRRISDGGTIRLVYFNAWPDANRGYNDLPDTDARAAVFDRALAAMTVFRPDVILLACNTLSIVYESTAFRRAPAAPVVGILEEGVELFCEAMARDKTAVLVLFGTRTTIASGEHLRRLTHLGIDPGRIIAEPCHGLAAAIDKDPDSPAVPGLVEDCVLRAVSRLPRRSTVCAGLACTHYAYVSEAFRASLARRLAARVEILDPAERLVDSLMNEMPAARPEGAGADISVEVVSKIELADVQRHAVARRIAPISPGTARALLEYRRMPDLF